MNAGLNVPASLTRRIGAKSEEKELAVSPVGYRRLKKNYTGNHLAARIIAIDERHEGLTFALSASRKHGA